MGVKSLGLGPGDEVLAPAYHHGSEIEALIQAGLVCRFYDTGPCLEPDEKELEALLGPHVRVLYLTHVMGFPQNAAYWRSWCDKRGLLLIEDAAQAWLSWRDGKWVGSHGDLSVFSVHKTLGLPDGALIISREPTESPPPKRQLGVRELAARHYRYLAQRWGWLVNLRRQIFHNEAGSREFDPEVAFALNLYGDPGRGPYASSRFLMKRVRYTDIQSRRVANYSFLLKHLRELVPDRFPTLTEGACPFAFPIQFDRKMALLELLMQHGVARSNFWPISHPALPGGGFPQAEKLRKSIIALPVHQELGRRELELIVEVTLNSIKNLG